jgi:Cu(I)/Ag(I) efflux system membrane fusion protein
MKPQHITIAVAAAAILIATAAASYWLGRQSTQPVDQAGAKREGQQGERIDPATGRKVLYWHDPMVPGHKFDKPGKSPFMDMQLVPVYADEAGDEGKVTISPRVQQNLGMRTAEVTRVRLVPALSAVGTVSYNERDTVMLQARANGYVERVQARAPLEPVRKGQALATLLVPDWVAAQEEYLLARRMAQAAGEGLVAAARQRMRLAGMTDAQIRQVESEGKVMPRTTVVSPINGVISELAVRDGMAVSPGMPLFRINGLDEVWVLVEVPEPVSAQVRPGALVEARASALPDAVFKGKVSALLPQVSASTRTLQVRVELRNPGHKLVPGMFMTVQFIPAQSAEVLAIPAEALIQTGKRSVVMLAQGDGKFAPVEVETGMEAKGLTEIRSGLEAGQKVVVSGQFLVDSEASLKGLTTRLNAHQADEHAGHAGAHAGAQSAPTVHRGEAKVESIDKEDIMLSHGPIASLNWPSMTMGFKLPPQGLPARVKPGDAVTFEFKQRPDGQFEIITITAAGGKQ